MMVQKRYFFHVSGFDPYDAAAQYRRFVRELARFATTWNVQAQVSAAHENSAADGRWTVTAQGASRSGAGEMKLPYAIPRD